MLEFQTLGDSMIGYLCKSVKGSCICFLICDDCGSSILESRLLFVGLLGSKLSVSLSQSTSACVSG